MYCKNELEWAKEEAEQHYKAQELPITNDLAHEPWGEEVLPEDAYDWSFLVENKDLVGVGIAILFAALLCMLVH